MSVINGYILYMFIVNLLNNLCRIELSEIKLNFLYEVLLRIVIFWLVVFFNFLVI